ncbi:hypothetical protein Tco_0513572 [Tanacetum coccineum]
MDSSKVTNTLLRKESIKAWDQQLGSESWSRSTSSTTSSRHDGISWRLSEEEKQEKSEHAGNKAVGPIDLQDQLEWVIDTRILACKEAIEDERFIAVKGSWKGKDEDVFLVCIYGPHVGRQKSSLWERLSSLMYRWQGA